MKFVLGDRAKNAAAQLGAAVRGSAAARANTSKPKPAEATILAEDGRSRGLVEQEIAGFYIVAENGTLAYVNPRFARMFGHEAAEIVGRPMVEFIPESEREAVTERFVAQMTGRERFSEFASTLLCKDGARVEVVVHSALATFGGQKASIGVVVDVSEHKRAAKLIHEEEAKFRSVLEQNVAGVVIVRDDGTIGYCNGYFSQLVGRAPEALVGHPLLELLPETERPIIAEQLRSQLGEGGAPVQIASTMRARNGSIVEVLVNASKATFEGHSASIAVVVDVTERNKAQRQLASTAAILATEHESSPDGILVVDPTARIISVNRRFGQIFEIPTELLAAGDDGPVRDMVLQQMADTETFERRVKYLYDHTEESGQDELVLKNGRVLDRFSAPFKASGGEYMGRIWFFSDITERRKAEESLRASEERFRMQIEEAPDAILLLDCDQDRFISANKAAERLFGVPRDQILKQGLQHFYTPQQGDSRPVAQSFRENRERALSGEQVILERRIRRVSGEERLCQLTLVRLPSKARMLRASLVDVTETNRAEMALQRLNRTLRTLSATGTAVVRALTEKELLDDMCRVAVETGGYRLAWIGLIEHDEAKTVRPAAWAGEHPEYVAGAKITWAEDARGEGPIGTAVRTGKAQVNQNVATDPVMAPWCAEMLKCGLKSIIALPLKTRSEVFGALALYAKEPDAFGPEEVVLLTELAADLAHGISAQRDHAGRESALLTLQENLRSTVEAIATAVEMRDAYTAGHQHRVAKLAIAIARRVGLREVQIEGLFLAATIHDVGKISVPTELLSKPGKLTPLEYQMLQTHVQTGYEIMKGINFPWPIAQIVLQHHERLDGSGYPQGLKGEAILPEAKILAVADVVEAMTSQRPYRQALGVGAAITEIELNKGRLYDPAAVEACVDLLRSDSFSFQ